MIHNKSTQPVLIKKIDLNIWTLRSEIETAINDKIIEENNDHSKVNISSILKEYDENSILPQSEEITPEENLDTGEDEMAKAMEGSSEEEVVETEVELAETPPKDESSNENKNVVVENGKTYVLQRRLNFSEEIVAKGITILSEVNMESMYFFSNKQYLFGQSIVIEFLVPNKFIANAEVVFCRPYNMKSRIISENRLSFRIGIKFKFLKTGERTLLRQFVKSIEPDIADAGPAKGPTDSEDGFDELDDLDL